MMGFSKKIGAIFCVAASFAGWFLSCRNDHCDDLMYAPTNLFFYSEVDTSVLVKPYDLFMQGVGTDSLIMIDNDEMVSISLDNAKESCQFAFAVTSEHSLRDTLSITDDSYHLTGEGLDRTFPSVQNVGNAFFFESFDNVWVLDEKIDDETFVVLRPEVDTLVMEYTNLLEFVSAECGCLTTHRLKSVKFLHNGIGTVSVVDSIVTNLSDAKNIKIYLENY